MKREELELLLTVARVLRAQVNENPNDPSGNNSCDVWALDEALKPFNGTGDEPRNLAANG
jgi:hypothetical protein